jgi:NADH-quinone oxidoreductase subunit H
MIVAAGETWWVALIEAFIVINILLLAFAYTTLLERKLLGRMQLRFGPNRAGKFGLLQPIADLLKLIRKEAFFPRKVEAIPYIVAPAFAAFTALLAFSVIPFGAGWEIEGYEVNGAVADVPIGLILVFALGSIGVYGFIVGGWASDSKYSLLGSMRTCAQLVSYEVSLSLSVIGVIMIAHSLDLTAIVDEQIATVWFVVPQLVGFAVFFVAAVAETARSPFDLTEADSEIVAGYHTEYSGMRWGLFQMAEYINMIVLAALAVTLFFGGFEGPYAPLGPVWFSLKLLIAITIFIWIRATVPRLRYDQLMRFGWKVLLPVATLNAIVTAAVVIAV